MHDFDQKHIGIYILYKMYFTFNIAVQNFILMLHTMLMLYTGNNYNTSTN